MRAEEARVEASLAKLISSVDKICSRCLAATTRGEWELLHRGARCPNLEAARHEDARPIKAALRRLERTISEVGAGVSPPPDWQQNVLRRIDASEARRRHLLAGLIIGATVGISFEMLVIWWLS